MSDSLVRLAAETREVAYSLRDLAGGWENDPDRLERVEARLALYRRLSTRFRCLPDDLSARLAESENRLATLHGLPMGFICSSTQH